ncbi:hypothetical protein PAMP_008863 [Pampus punctatissimus]
MGGLVGAVTSAGAFDCHIKVRLTGGPAELCLHSLCDRIGRGRHRPSSVASTSPWPALRDMPERGKAGEEI